MDESEPLEGEFSTTITLHDIPLVIGYDYTPEQRGGDRDEFIRADVQIRQVNIFGRECTEFVLVGFEHELWALLLTQHEEAINKCNQ